MGQLDRVERRDVGSKGRTDAARRTSAALVETGLVAITLVGADLVSSTRSVWARIGNLRMCVPRRDAISVRMASHLKARMMLADTARQHGRGRDTLQRQSHGQKAHENESNDATHAQKSK